MNKRIQELADKSIEDMPGAWNIPDEFCKKFAELIVKDIIDSVVYDPNSEDFGSPCDGVYADIENRIKKHFGVEQ